MLFVAALNNQGHRRQSIHLERVCRRRAEIDHPPMHEGTAVIDPHNRRAAVTAIDDCHFGAKRQRTVRCRHGARTHLFAARGIMVAIHRGDTRTPKKSLRRTLRAARRCYEPIAKDASLVPARLRLACMLLVGLLQAVFVRQSRVQIGASCQESGERGCHECVSKDNPRMR